MNLWQLRVVIKELGREREGRESSGKQCRERQLKWGAFGERYGNVVQWILIMGDTESPVHLLLPRTGTGLHSTDLLAKGIT